MTTQTPRDGLLTTARVVLVIVKVLFIIGIVALGIALPAILLSAGKVQAALLPAAAGNLPAALAAIVLVLLCGIAVFALALRFVTALQAIVATVGEGDPFVPANAERLARMGWQVLIIQGLGIAIALSAAWLVTQFPEGAVKVNAIFSPSGLILALVLFILARVFHHGTELRAELEGTV